MRLPAVVPGCILGGWGPTDSTTGLELQYDDILTGTDGDDHGDSAFGGTPIAGGTYEVTDAVNGTDVILGITPTSRRRPRRRLSTQ